jgi:hypothetical protein
MQRKILQKLKNSIIMYSMEIKITYVLKIINKNSHQSILLTNKNHIKILSVISQVSITMETQNYLQ